MNASVKILNGDCYSVLLDKCGGGDTLNYCSATFTRAVIGGGSVLLNG